MVRGAVVRKKAHKEEESVGSHIFTIFLYVFFMVFTFICVYPFYYLIINSISANDMSGLGQIILIPHKIHFDNYRQVLTLPGLAQSALISVGRSTLGPICTLCASAFLGFMFTQEKLWLRALWYRFVIATMYFNAGLIPWYITMVNLRLNNNFLAYILLAVVSPFCIILVKTYIESLPKELQEAAEIDGAGIFRVFSQVIFPLCTPILATVVIFAAVWQWNSFQDTLVLMTNQKLYPLQFMLYQYINQAVTLAQTLKNGQSSSMVVSAASTQTALSVRMTVSVIVVLPILIVYPFFQRYFVKGIMIGAVKG